MTEWQISILLDIIAGMLLFIFGWSSNWIYIWFRERRPFSNVLGTLGDREKQIIIVIPKLYSHIEEIKLKIPRDTRETILWNPLFPLYAEGDAAAMMYAYNLLLESGKKYDQLKIKSDVELLGIERQSELICIGAGSNSVTKEFLTITDPPITFEQIEVRTEGIVQRIFGIAIIDRRTGERWTATEKYDFGLIIRMNNPRNSSVDSFILAGLGPVGTAASGFFLSTQWRQIYNALRRERLLHGNYAAVIKANINDHTDVTLIKISGF